MLRLGPERRWNAYENSILVVVGNRAFLPGKTGSLPTELT